MAPHSAEWFIFIILHLVFQIVIIWSDLVLLANGCAKHIIIFFYVSMDDDDHDAMVNVIFGLFLWLHHNLKK